MTTLGKATATASNAAHHPESWCGVAGIAEHGTGSTVAMIGRPQHGLASKDLTMCDCGGGYKRFVMLRR